MKIKKILLGLILLSFSIQLSKAQKISIEGKISTQKEVPLIGATIQINDQFNTISDANGAFSLMLEKPDSKYQVLIRMLGYVTIDTTLQSSLDKIYLDIKMQEETFDIPSIEITADGFNAFDYDQWNILDFNFQDGNILILYVYGRERNIGLFTANGLKVHTISLSENFNQIFQSCSGKIHLLGNNKGAELLLKDQQLHLLKIYKKELFDQLIKPCITTCKEELIFKNLTNHNKKALYFKYPEPNSPLLIKEIFDKKSAKVAQSYYNEIIGLYNYTTLNSEEGDIDEGIIEKDNIIARGMWSGDLFDLIISNELLFAVAYYQNVESKAIDVREFEFNDKFYVMDFVNKELLKIDIQKLKTTKLQISDFGWHKKNKILQDKTSNKVYILSPKGKLSSIVIQKSTCVLNEESNPELTGNFPKGFQMYNGDLYYFSYKDGSHRTSQLHKVSLR